MSPIDKTDKRDDKLPGEQRWVRAQLEHAAAELEGPIVLRLRAARLQAVAAAEARHASRATWWLPLSTAAAATLVAVTLVTLWWRAPDSTIIGAAPEDMEMLTSRETPDLVNEQIEFYHWLGDEEDAG